VVYAGYVWLVGRAGAVFAAQVAYLVTLFGVFWAMLILGETLFGLGLGRDWR
jgi:drug/metabolite transporter (DMT)-like permease